ncbi:hypothetical protein CHOCRA_000171 [Candidatus Hodgkinia cicadicola]|nr:hypothetical protein CHOCRA_000171 [Candidatus Hodgkinia cicadicola]
MAKARNAHLIPIWLTKNNYLCWVQYWPREYIASYYMLLVPLLILATTRRMMIRISWVARLAARLQIELNLKISAADRKLIKLNECALKAYEIWLRIFLNARCKLISSLFAWAAAAGVLMFGFEVEFATIALVVLANVISVALCYSIYVLVITCECRFRLRLLAAAPLTATLAIYTLHDLVLPQKCYYGMDTPKVLSQAYWPFPSLQPARKRKKCAMY